MDPKQKNTGPWKIVFQQTERTMKRMWNKADWCETEAMRRLSWRDGRGENVGGEIQNQTT